MMSPQVDVIFVGQSGTRNVEQMLCKKLSRSEHKQWHGNVLMWGVKTKEIAVYNLFLNREEIIVDTQNVEIEEASAIQLKNGNMIITHTPEEYTEYIVREIDVKTGKPVLDFGEHGIIINTMGQCCIFELDNSNIAIVGNSTKIFDAKTAQLLYTTAIQTIQIKNAIRLQDGSFVCYLANSEIVQYDSRFHTILHKSRLMCDGGLIEYLPGVVVRATGTQSIDKYDFDKDETDPLFAEQSGLLQRLVPLEHGCFLYERYRHGSQQVLYNRGKKYDLVIKPEAPTYKVPSYTAVAVKIDRAKVICFDSTRSVIVYDVHGQVEGQFKFDKDYRMLCAILE
jgi:hypothetical protein